MNQSKLAQKCQSAISADNYAGGMRQTVEPSEIKILG
jgi:hypothetical protein